MRHPLVEKSSKTPRNKKEMMTNPILGTILFLLTCAAITAAVILGFFYTLKSGNETEVGQKYTK